MEATSSRWHRVTPSTFPWEDEAIEFLRAGVPDADPTRAWSNFELISGGVISEVDVFLLTRKGAFLIEIKSTPGRLTGDQQRWTFHRPDGRKTSMENPLLVTNRKAKRIKSLLEARWGQLGGPQARHAPFVQPLVFLSDPNLEVALRGDARVHVHGRDGAKSAEGLGGILHAVTHIGQVEADDPRFRQLNTPTTTAVAKALESVGIKESNHTRRVGDWVLRLGTVADRPGIQDFVADHQHLPDVVRRVRIYSKPLLMSDEQAQSLSRAADREFLAAERIAHPNVVRAVDRTETELGSAVVFEHDPSAVRLDHWLADTDDLGIDDRLLVLRQLAETLQAVHRRKVTHRALSPGSVLIRPGRRDEPRWVVKVTDFALAGRDHATAAGSTAGSLTSTGTRFGLPTAAPGDVDLLADESALVYCAPELTTGTDPDGVSLDVFSFGAIAYHVLSGHRPAESRDALRTALKAGDALQLSLVVPGVTSALDELVMGCTRPKVEDRESSFEDVLAGLDLAEEELTAPEVTTPPEQPIEVEVDPLDAKKGDHLGDDALVLRRLGRGSTAVALLVDRGEDASPRQVVYKVSIGGDADARVREEARILADLDHPAIVRTHGVIELAQRPVLVESLAGGQSLADELRRNGTPGLEFLHRWGDDLLSAAQYLEGRGRWHRDIKPDNLGIAEVSAKTREQRLVLYDFSLASAPASDIRAGTPPYLEPFLADRPTKAWDDAAERYAVAITLYEMATGEVPVWGDGQSDPSFTTEEVTLDPVLFDPGARDQLEAFFRTALRRDPDERFGNAEAMRAAWHRVFEGIDAADTDAETDGPSLDEPSSTKTAGGPPNQTARPTIRLLPETLGLDDPVVSLRTSAKVLSALGRLDVSTVRQLSTLVPSEVTRAKRISPKVRRRILQLRSEVLTRFADDLAATVATTTTIPTTPATAPTETGDDQGRADESAARTPPTLAEAPKLDLDLLLTLLVPPRSGRGPEGQLRPAVRMLLGLDPVPGDDGGDWPSQTAVADALGVTRGRLGQIGPQARAHWADLDALRSVRDELVALITDLGGVVAVGELDALLVDSRGTGRDAGEAAAAARAVARAALDSAGKADDRRIVVRRHGRRVLVATQAFDDDGEPTGPDAAAVASYAADLGARADEALARADDVIPQDRALPLLRSVTAPDGVRLGDGRLIRLAAAASQAAGASAALELYPADLSAERAVRLARPSLAGADSLSVDEVHDRVRARFPLVTLPGRPELDALLRAADVAATWNEAKDRFDREATTVGGLTRWTPPAQRPSTSVLSRRRTRPPVDEEAAPEVAAAVELEERLLGSLARGGFLALRTPTSEGPALRRELARFTGEPHRVASVDVEAWFLDELRQAAAVRRIEWERLVTADLSGPGSTGYTNLRILTGDAAKAVEARVGAAGLRVMVWNAGILARYDQMDVIDRLRNRAGLADSGLQTLWLVVFGPTADPRPMLDGHPVPVLGPSEWADVPTGWLERRHHAHLATGTDRP